MATNSHEENLLYVPKLKIKLQEYVDNINGHLYPKTYCCFKVHLKGCTVYIIKHKHNV